MAFKKKADEEAYRRAYYAANRERLLAGMKSKYAVHREAVKARVRAYAKEHRLQISERGKAYRQANKEKLRANQRAYYLAHREERIAYQKALHKKKADAVKAYKKSWWARNRERFAADRKTPERRAAAKMSWSKWYRETYYTKHREKFLSRAAKRKALKSGASAEPIDYKQILRDSKGVCGICGRPLDLFGIDFDHIVPLSRGGSHTRDNLQATHQYCNRAKGAKVG
jgi:5-methylcytosine-specific restriction endonuclease McrA